MLQIFNIPHVLETYGYVGIFIIVFLESGILFTLPGDSLLFTAGLMVALLDMHLYVLIPLIFIATFLGGVVGYEVGVNLERLHNYAFFRKILKKENIDKTHKFFDKYGKFTVIISRFVPLARTFVPIVAGIARMHYREFIKYSLVSSALWSTSVTLLGFFLGRAFPHIKDYMSHLIIIIVLLSLLPIIYEMLRKEKKD
jgi:membrane-associated protein